ncbi:HisA/HisF-related TIM barrel protein [Candidatus Vidania fulgoroideorum]
MFLIPALDIYNRNCVRLIKGGIKNLISYSKNPFKVICFFLNNNIKKIHIIDLNSAFNLSLKNINLIIKLIFLKNIFNYSKFNLGGGIRSIKKINFFIKKKIESLTISTLIFNYSFFLKKSYKKIFLGIDFSKNRFFSHGWKKSNNKLEINKKIKIILTNIERDGTLLGISKYSIFNILNILKIKYSNVIISGGIKNLKEVKNLRAFKFFGFIIGISFYEKKFFIFKC